MPLILQRMRGFRLLEATDLGVSDYAAPVATPEFCAATQQDTEYHRRILEALPKCDLLRIRPVREDDRPKFEKLFGSHAHSLGFSSHATDLAPPYEECRKSHINASLRKMIDRKTRKLKREHGVTIMELRDADEIRQAIAGIAALRAGRFEGDVIHDDFAREFYTDIAMNGAEAGLASTWRLRVGDADVGFVFGLTHGGRFYYLLIGCDYDGFGNYSPGLQLYDAIMRGWTEQGGSVFDFTIGDEAFKMKFGTQPTPIHAFFIPRSQLGWLAGKILRRKRDRQTGGNMTPEDMLRNSTIVAAHPDNELFWFGAILKKVDRVVIVYEDFWPKPEVGEARAAVFKDYPRDGATSLQLPEAATHSCADWDNPKLTEFGIELGTEATLRDVKQSVKRMIGRGSAPSGGIRQSYEANSRTLCEKLKPLLTSDMNVFTHNPWGEYGHEDHLQVFRVVDRLRGEVGFKLWMSNYCTDRALPLAMTYFDNDERDYVQLPVDTEFADLVADTYRRHQCWTWADNWRWFPFELFTEAPTPQSNADGQTHLLPMNIFRFDH